MFSLETAFLEIWENSNKYTSVMQFVLNPFHVTDLYLYPMKISEDLRFYDVAEVTERDQWNKMG